nr:outer mitochondrial transmembrane helix translocase isoform X4 [Peromyscus maniculatus bairdii]
MLCAGGAWLRPEAFPPRRHFFPVRGRARAPSASGPASGLIVKMVHAEAFSRPLSRNEVVGLIFRLTIFGAVTYFTIKWMVDAIDPTRKQKVEAQKQAEKLMKQIGVKNVKLSEYEMSIAAHLVDPLNMHVTWSDIAGLDDVITDLKDTVILPIKKKHLFENSRLLQPPKGVLLYGPPGCGKTLIAKATAKEAGCRFINLQPSTLTDKWYGESQKLAAAVFSLAIKLQPSIIFIDEIDSFLRNRSSSDHEATAMMKAQFMSLWDGLDTDHSCQVIVMGATNRPQDLDSAIMRRMPTRFHINQPALKQREAILKLILKNENVDRHVDLLEVAQETDGFSGSDLKEMCRDAALLCVREYVNSTSEERKESTWRYFQYGELQVSHDIWQKLSLLLLTGIQKETFGEQRLRFDHGQHVSRLLALEHVDGKDKKRDIHWIISRSASCFYRQKITLGQGEIFSDPFHIDSVCSWKWPPEQQDIRKLALNIRNLTGCQILTVKLGNASRSEYEQLLRAEQRC